MKIYKHQTHREHLRYIIVFSNFNLHFNFNLNFIMKEDQQEEDDEEEEPEGEPSVPEEFMFEAEGVALEDDMMKVRT